MKIIFETSMMGHRYEYLHNLYLYAGKELREKVVFVLPKDERVELWKNDFFSNITLEYLSEEDLKLCLKNNLLIASYFKAQVLKKYVKKYWRSSNLRGLHETRLTKNHADTIHEEWYVYHSM